MPVMVLMLTWCVPWEIELWVPRWAWKAIEMYQHVCLKKTLVLPEPMVFPAGADVQKVWT